MTDPITWTTMTQVEHSTLNRLLVWDGQFRRDATPEDLARCGFVPSTALQQATAEVTAIRETSESWRKAHAKWQGWADAVLRELGAQPEGGMHGDEPARDVIRQHLSGVTKERDYWAKQAERCGEDNCAISKLRDRAEQTASRMRIVVIAAQSWRNYAIARGGYEGLPAIPKILADAVSAYDLAMSPLASPPLTPEGKRSGDAEPNCRVCNKGPTEGRHATDLGEGHDYDPVDAPVDSAKGGGERCGAQYFNSRRCELEPQHDGMHRHGNDADHVRWVGALSESSPKRPLTLEGGDIYEWKRIAEEEKATNEEACAILYNTGATRGDVVTRAKRAKESYHELINDTVDLQEKLDTEKARAESAEAERDATESERARIVSMLNNAATALGRDLVYPETLADAVNFLRIDRDATRAARDALRAKVAAMQSNIDRGMGAIRTALGMYDPERLAYLNTTIERRGCVDLDYAVWRLEYRLRDVMTERDEAVAKVASGEADAKDLAANGGG